MCIYVNQPSLIQARKLSLQQLHSMSDEEWRGLNLPVVSLITCCLLLSGHITLYLVIFVALIFLKFCVC